MKPIKPIAWRARRDRTLVGSEALGYRAGLFSLLESTVEETRDSVARFDEWRSSKHLNILADEVSDLPAVVSKKNALRRLILAMGAVRPGPPPAGM